MTSPMNRRISRPALPTQYDMLKIASIVKCRQKVKEVQGGMNSIFYDKKGVMFTQGGRNTFSKVCRFNEHDDNIILSSEL